LVSGEGFFSSMFKLDEVLKIEAGWGVPALSDIFAAAA